MTPVLQTVAIIYEGVVDQGLDAALTAAIPGRAAPRRSTVQPGQPPRRYLYFREVSATVSEIATTAKTICGARYRFAIFE